MKNKISKKEQVKRMQLLKEDPYGYFLKYDNDKKYNEDSEDSIFSKEEMLEDE
jgi:hypothetical protein